MEQVPGQTNVGSEGVGKQKMKAGYNVVVQGDIFQPQQTAELGNFSHVALALESRIEEVSGIVDAG